MTSSFPNDVAGPYLEIPEEKIPEKNNFLEFMIPHIDSPDNFYVQLRSEAPKLQT
jgi:hypothetical protein